MEFQYYVRKVLLCLEGNTYIIEKYGVTRFIFRQGGFFYFSIIYSQEILKGSKRLSIIWVNINLFTFLIIQIRKVMYFCKLKNIPRIALRDFFSSNYSCQPVHMKLREPWYRVPIPAGSRFFRLSNLYVRGVQGGAWEFIFLKFSLKKGYFTYMILVDEFYYCSETLEIAYYEYVTFYSHEWVM